ncbi:hypothetical protein LguiA_012592 [Lonicera macranthoides]
MAKSIDFSNTHRIVLFINLTPPLQNPNPNSYLKSIIIASKSLLSFPSFSSPLFAFRFFSPLRSSSILHRINPKSFSTSLSFDRPIEILHSLSQTLISLSTTSISYEFGPSSSSASYLASSPFQLMHDYAWKCRIESRNENLLGSDCGFLIIRSNLIVLFSPICKSSLPLSAQSSSA